LAIGWTRFSKLPHTIAQICKEDMAEVFDRYSVKLTHVKEIGWDKERGKFGEMVTDFIECDDIDKALQIGRDWKGIALTYKVEAIWTEMVLNLWPDDRGRTNFCLDLEPDVVAFESDDYERGQWIVAFLLAVTVALKADCCGSGRSNDYNYVFEALDCARVVSRLKDGSLLDIVSQIHIISTRLISSTDVRAAIAEHPKDPPIQYRESVGGYHVLFNV